MITIKCKHSRHGRLPCNILRDAFLVETMYHIVSKIKYKLYRHEDDVIHRLYIAAGHDAVM